MKSNIIESILGAVVLAIGLSVLIFAYSTGKSTTPRAGYSIVAKFDRADGVLVGSDVRMSGIKVGSVTGARLDPISYMAEVTMTIERDVKLPTDTSAEIASEGLLGGKYLALVPGGADDMLKPGDEITHTQSSVNLESLIGQMIFSKSNDTNSPT